MSGQREGSPLPVQTFHTSQTGTPNFRWAQRGLDFGNGCLFVPLLLYFMVIWLQDVYRTHRHTYRHTDIHTYTREKYKFPMSISSTVLLLWRQPSKLSIQERLSQLLKPTMARTHSVPCPLLLRHVLKPRDPTAGHLLPRVSRESRYSERGGMKWAGGTPGVEGRGEQWKHPLLLGTLP